ncbi:MAG TPA: prolyl oligopeptidase family serine peptidase [Polyangiales bacterium]|nr:prolyl oligopeptidase family serine peptidase [Polyangiales bacterium]
MAGQSALPVNAGGTGQSAGMPAGSGGAGPGTAGTGAAPTTPSAGSAAPMTPPVTGNAGAMAMNPAIEMPPATPSSGCNAADFPASGTFMIDVAGMPREYIVKIPADYDASKPYKLVFAWHGLGGTAAQVAGGSRGGYYGLESRAMGSTIFAAGQGLQTSNSVGSGPGWPNTNGQDVAFVRALYDWLRSKYCIDEQRVFSTGMSYGGIMSNTLGCQMGDVFRAIAPMSGSGPRGMCTGQVAVWMSHGNTDTVVPFDSTVMGGFSGGVQSRDFWAKANHCETTTTVVGPERCVAYEGCDEGHPVHWCEFDGGHTIPSYASEAIWSFFSMF